MLPYQKEKTISKLKSQQNKIVSMAAEDGINNTPALARADSGILLALVRMLQNK